MTASATWIGHADANATTRPVHDRGATVSGGARPERSRRTRSLAPSTAWHEGGTATRGRGGVRRSNLGVFNDLVEIFSRTPPYVAIVVAAVAWGILAVTVRSARLLGDVPVTCR